MNIFTLDSSNHNDSNGLGEGKYEWIVSNPVYNQITVLSVKPAETKPTITWV